jgi:hypothetical protein
MRRCALRGIKNSLQRPLIHVGAFDISLMVREMLGADTSRELKARAVGLILSLFAYFFTLCGAVGRLPGCRDEVSSWMEGICTEGLYC